VFRIGFFSNNWVLGGVGLMIVLQLLFTYLPVMNLAFGSKPITFSDWGLIIIASSIVYVVIECEKLKRQKRDCHMTDPFL
jgi:Ca2+-transporting ATPase